MAARLRPTPDEPRTRLKQASLWSPTRLAILDVIRERPACSMTDVARAIGRDEATVSTNVRLLRDAGVIIVDRNGRRMALYLTGQLSARERLLARVGDSRPILDAISRGHPESAASIAHELGLSRNVVRYHLGRLARLGLIRTIETKVLVTRTRFVLVDE